MDWKQALDVAAARMNPYLVRAAILLGLVVLLGYEGRVRPQEARVAEPEISEPAPSWRTD